MSDDAYTDDPTDAERLEDALADAIGHIVAVLGIPDRPQVAPNPIDLDHVPAAAVNAARKACDFLALGLAVMVGDADVPIEDGIAFVLDHTVRIDGPGEAPC